MEHNTMTTNNFWRFKMIRKKNCFTEICSINMSFYYWTVVDIKCIILHLFYLSKLH